MFTSDMRTSCLDDDSHVTHYFTALSCGSLSPWTLSPERSLKRQRKLQKVKKTEGGESIFGTESDTVLRS